MAGLIAFAPIYLNGVLSLLFLFVIPGLAMVSAVDIPSFPQRWLAIFLSSLAVNHLLVTLIAAFHLDPLTTCRIVIATLVAVVLAMWALRYRTAAAGTPAGGAVASSSDLVWLLISLVTLGGTYFNIWKHGVPNVFTAGDVSVSWNVWARLWAEGLFPTGSIGYPQFIPTIWATTYIFTGSPVQYFAFYSYLGLITIPIVLNAMNLGRISWWCPLVAGLAFVWFIAEIREQWLRLTLQEAYPDWVAAIFAFCGVVLFIVHAPNGRFDREKIVAALLALALLSMATVTKPLYGLPTLAIFLGISIDACRLLAPDSRNKFLAAAAGTLLLFAILYTINYVHLAARGMPYYPVTELSERLAGSFRLFNANFTLPFRILIGAGLLLSPFAGRIRWLALPLFAAIWLWANTAAYDLRNILGFLLIAAFIPLYLAARAGLAHGVGTGGRQWRVPDGVIAVILMVAAVGLTSRIALSDNDIKKKFADAQLQQGLGVEFNQEIARLLERGCTIFTATGYINTIIAFERYRPQMHPFFFSLPLDAPLTERFNAATGCTALFYPPGKTHPTILNFFDGYIPARDLKPVRDDLGMRLLASPP